MLVDYEDPNVIASLTKKGNKLFKEPASFLTSVFEVEQLPDYKLPEIAFWGRSNVGKSSLINALFSINSIAKVSSTPGRTQALNFFALGKDLVVVDMPGYGYAKAPLKVIKNWHSLVKFYLQGRVNLKRVFLLIDARLGLKDNDRKVMKELDDYAVSYQIVLTKSDKVNSLQLDKVAKNISQELKKSFTAAFPHIIISSAHKNLGLGALRGFVVPVVGGS